VVFGILMVGVGVIAVMMRQTNIVFINYIVLVHHIKTNSTVVKSDNQFKIVFHFGFISIMNIF
jgi:hypothetical protein